jgi:hypothetical protein
MSISEMVNAPISVTIGSKPYKIQRMTLKEILAPMQAKILADNKNLIDESTEGLSPKEKAEFRYAHAISAAQLDTMAFEYMATPIGTAEMLLNGLNKCQPVSEQEVSDMILRANEDELMFIQSYLTGETVEIVKKKQREAKLLEAVQPK